MTALPHRRGCGPASRRVPLEEQERWKEAPPGRAGVPPACTPVDCRSVSLRRGTRQTGAPSSRAARVMGGGPTRERGRPARMHSALRAAQFPCDVAPGHPAGGNGKGPCQSRVLTPLPVYPSGADSREAVPGLARAGRPRSRVGIGPAPQESDRNAPLAAHRPLVLFIRPYGSVVSLWYDPPTRTGTSLI